MKIRKATVRDARKMCDFMQAICVESPPTLYRRKRPPTIDEERAFIRKSNRRGVVLICSAGDVLGVIVAGIPSAEQRAHTCEFGMSVLAAHRGRGIGTRLLKALESWALGRGLRRIECAAFGNNVKGIRLYKRMGYRVEGRRRQAIEVGGRYLDIVELGKIL